MKEHDILILAAVGLGAFILTRKASAGTTGAYMTARNPANPLVNARPYYITPQQNPAAVQAQIDTARLNAWAGIGNMVGSWFRGGSSATATEAPGAGNLTGSVRPSTDFGAGTYSPPDSTATNPPYNSYEVDSSGAMPLMSSSDLAALHSNDGYYFYTQ
jgi:hypothetical protein